MEDFVFGQNFRHRRGRDSSPRKPQRDHSWIKPFLLPLQGPHSDGFNGFIWTHGFLEKIEFNLQLAKKRYTRLSNKPYVNEVTLTEHNIKSCYSSQLKLCLLKRLRTFQRGTLGLCRLTGCKVTSYQSWRMILSSRNRIWAALMWFD